jgi:PAS domain S-box-containing protein
LIVNSTKEYAIFMLDTGGHVQSWNTGAQRIKGYEADEIIGQPFSVFYTDEDIKSGKPARELQCAIAEGQYEEDGWRVRKDGSRFWTNVIITALRDKQGRHIGFSKISRDLTDRKQSEDAIARMNETLQASNAQLEAANKELEAFSYSVSHDLRAPLRSIDGFSQALLEDYKDKLDEEGQDHLNRVRASTQRMGQLIDDLLNLSRASRGEMIREKVDVSKLAREIAEELRATEPKRSVEFVITDGLFAETDLRLLRIVLTNLLGNAWKFTAKRADARIEFGVEGENGSRSFFARDNGAGFDMNYASKLFGAFQRLHAVTEYPGTGIGLATVQRIINRQGGRIWAEGKLQEGATFRFSLGSKN